MYVGLYVKYLLFSSDCSQTGLYLIDLNKNLPYTASQNSVQREPLERTEDTTELTAAFSQLCERVKKVPCNNNRQIDTA
jgi:hypothetical protein